MGSCRREGISERDHLSERDTKTLLFSLVISVLQKVFEGGNVSGYVNVETGVQTEDSQPPLMSTKFPVVQIDTRSR